MIIRGVVPEIMHRSNDILAAMTGGRMAVDIRTEKEQRSTKQIVNSLEVWISSIAGTNRPYLSHSGGEKVKIGALAVTLGLADVKARRAGVQLECCLSTSRLSWMRMVQGGLRRCAHQHGRQKPPGCVFWQSATTDHEGKIFPEYHCFRRRERFYG